LADHPEGPQDVLIRTAQRNVASTIVIIALLGWSHANAGEYQLRAGDTIDIFAAGVPELKQRLTLDVDGHITLPLAGVVHASGSTIAELREKVSSAARAALQQLLPGTVQGAIEPNDIAVNVVEYSPVYVNGDVAKPGEQRFRPELTVRQAVALAGGYEVMRYHLIDPVIQSADLQADYETYWTEQAREQARLARLNAELNNEVEMGEPAVDRGPIPHQLASDLVNNETQQLSLWNANNNNEIAFLNRAIKNATDQLAELTEQRGKEKEGVEADSAELQKLAMFQEKGDVTSNRVVDARRAMLLSSTRLLQTEEQIIQITREKEGYLRRIERLNEENKLDILKQIQESKIKLAALNARISATADKLVYASTMRSQLPLSRAGLPTVLIVRRTNETLNRIDATEDTTLEPGDVVEISLVPKSNMAENR
jgi:polysaccharide biosynthesis/export protein